MDPNPVDKLYLLLQLGRFSEAERAAREEIAEDPESSSGYYYLAQALLCLNRFQEALDVSDRVLALAPNHCFAHIQRSALLQNLGRLAEAVEVAETAMRLDPAEPIVHLHLAVALSTAGRREESAAVISKAHHQFPDHPGILYQVGILALGQKDMAKVVEVAKQGLALDPTSPEFHMLAGVATGQQAQKDVPEGPERQNRYRVAEQQLEDAVRMDPTNTAFRSLRKINARDSRDGIMVTLMTGWLFGMVLGVIVLPIVLRGSAVPCWCWLVLPPVVWLLGLLSHARCPEFSLILPLERFNAVTVPLLPEERRKGYVMWFIFLTVTAAALFLPMLLMPVDHHAPDTQPTLRDNGFRLPLPAKGKTQQR